MEVVLELGDGYNWKTFEVHGRKSLDFLEGTLGRNMDVKGASGEVSDRNEEHVIGNWEKGHPCYKLGKNWLNCSLVLCGR